MLVKKPKPDFRYASPFWLRDAQKYAVKVGGDENHRIGLFDQILIKENHIASVGGITQVIQRKRANASKSKFRSRSKPL